MFAAFLLLLLSGSLTQLAQPGSFLLTVATAHAAAAGTSPKDGKNTFKPEPDRGGTPHRPANQVKIAGPNKTPQIIKRNQGYLTPPFDVVIDPLAATTTTSPDTQITVSVPARAITPEMVTKLGGVPHLRVTQLQGPSGGSDGGHVIFGSFLITLMGPHGAVASGLARPITVTLRLPESFRGAGADMLHVQAIITPSDAHGRPLKPANDTTTAQAAVAPVATRATYATTARTLTATFTATSGGSTGVTWDTNAPDAHWSAQADASVDLPSGDLTYSYPLDVPTGPGGLTPKLQLSYDSASVSENHSPKATAGWLGEGWSLTGGSISWGEHNVTSVCFSHAQCPSTPPDCSLTNPVECQTWEDSWQFSDPYGNGGELIPQDSNLSPWWDDTANGGLTTTTEPINWHLNNENGVKIYSYTNPTANPYFPAQFYPTQPPCFRAFLPNGSMEEFGCTTDSLQWYVNTNAINYQSYYIYRWDLDMVVDASGNQIHYQYKQAINGLAGLGGNFPIDAALSSISYDSAACHSTTTRCSGSSWQPAAQIVFSSDYAPTHLTNGTCPTTTNTTTYTSSQTMRCDDVKDLSGSQGEAAPALQSLYALNQIQVQVTTTPTAPGWHTLRSYNFSYEQTAPQPITDPTTNQQESVAGYLDLASIQEVGDDNTTTLPPLTMSYASYVENYVDQVYNAPTTDCGPSWNSVACNLWAKTWNTRYLSEIDNGQGWKESFTYGEAHNNTHGVNSGLNLLDPLACDGHQANGNTCAVADDQNWSRIVLTKRVAEVDCVTLQGGTCNGSDNGLGHDSSWSYTYSLTDVTNLAKECGDCTQTMYWGDQNDGDTADFYNAHFAGFRHVNVTSPDGSLQVSSYYTTKGYGVATSTIATNYCQSLNTCYVSPWSDPLNALHGRAQEEDDYDTNATTLLKQTLTTYAVTCPPNGVSASAHNASNPNVYYVGQNSSELDPNNPLVVCRLDTTQVDSYQVDGGAALSGTHTTVAYTYTYGSSTHIATMKEDHSSSNTGSRHIITVTQYIWNDTVTAAPTSANGVYFDQLPGKTQIQSETGDYKGCTYNGYDGGTIGLTGQQAGVVRGLVTTTTRYASNCTPGSESGGVSTQVTYNANGDPLGTKDADALGGVSGHTNSVSCTIGSVAYSACANYDSLYGTQVTDTYNALRHALVLNYTTDGANTNSPDASNGWGQWLTSSTDANLRVSAYGYDPLGRLTATALPNSDTLSSPTSSYQYLVTCPTSGASTPCAALVTTQRLVSGSTTTTSATYYNGWGQPVESVKPYSETILGSMTILTYSVSYTLYDPANRKMFVSDPYFVSQGCQCSPGTPPYFAPDNTIAGTAIHYDGLGRTKQVVNPLGHPTNTAYSEQQPQGASFDTQTYAATTVTDANSHSTTTLSDGLGRTTYTEAFNWNGDLVGTTYTTYDYLNDVLLVYGPAASGTPGVNGTAQTTTTYDLLGRAQTMDDADLGHGWQYFYDPNGNQTSVIDPRGVSGGGAVYAGYDGLNRPLWRNTTNSPTGAYVSYTYDETTSHGYGIGHLTSESFTGGDTNQPLHGSYSYYYGARGEIAHFNLTTTEGTGYGLAYSYNDAMQPTSLTYSDGEVFSAQYNADGWLTSASTTPSGGSQINLLTNVSYSGTGGAAGRLTSANLGNGTYALSASYDDALQFTSLTLTNVSLGTTVFATQRGYDPVGMVVSVNTTLANGTDNQVFCYDSLNRLVWAGSTGTPSCARTISQGTLTAANYTATYSYDATNRITSGSLGTLSYGDSAHFHAATSSSSGETASYDTNGDMQCRAPTSATTCAGGSPTGAHLDYDAERRLTHWQNAPSNPTTQAWYLYDGSGNRVEQYVSGGSGNHTYYLPGGVEEVTPSGSLIKYYSAGGMTLGLNTARDASGIAYLASDGLGSVSEALSPGGSATGAVLYSPYGGVRYTSGAMPTSKGFTGQYSDASSSGLDYYGARYYDPALGQFTSADTTNDGLNRYGYVKGNPETYTDPTGHRMNCDDGYCDKPPPSGDGGGGDCTSDATCGCYASCGGGNPTKGNGTGDGNSGCHGSQLCAPNPQKTPEAKSPTKEPPCDRICKARQDASNAASFWRMLAFGLGGVLAFLGIINQFAKDPVLDGLITALTVIALDAGWLAIAFQKQADDWKTAADWSDDQMTKFVVVVDVVIDVIGALAVAAGLYITTLDDAPIEWNPAGAALDLARKAAIFEAGLWVGMIGGSAFIGAATYTIIQENQDLHAGQN